MHHTVRTVNSSVNCSQAFWNSVWNVFDSVVCLWSTVGFVILLLEAVGVLLIENNVFLEYPLLHRRKLLNRLKTS